MSVLPEAAAKMMQYCCSAVVAGRTLWSGLAAATALIETFRATRCLENGCKDQPQSPSSSLMLKQRFVAGHKLLLL
jgi:hypothetical protein